MNKIKRFIPFILIGIVILFSLGKTLQYYFYTDDFVFLYNLRNNLEFGWPYNSVLPLFRPIYNLFGTNALSYFSLALFTYFLASIASYFFIKVLTRNNLIAFLSALIFATGYIGLDQFTMNAVSIVNNLNIVNVCITLILLICWINTGKLRYYFLTFLMFWFSIHLFPYRAYPLILFLPTLELFKSFKLGSVMRMIKQLVFIIIRFVPFVLVASRNGIFSYGTYGTVNVNLFSQFTNPHSRIFALLNIEVFKEVFAILGRFVLVKPISDIFSFVPDQGFFAFTGFIFSLVILLTSLFFLLGKYSGYARSLLIVLFLTIEGYVGNMLLNLDFDSNGPVSRYLTISFLSFSAIFPLFLFLVTEKLEKYKKLNKKWTLVFPIILFVFCFASLSRTYENSIIRDRSIPAINFFTQLKTYIPKLSNSNYSIFYFDHALYAPVSARFGNVLISAAMDISVNLAVPYEISTSSAKIVSTFDNFLYLVQNPPSDKKALYYTFYDDEKGLRNTTDKVFALLKNGSRNVITENKIQYDKNQGSSSIAIETNGVSSLTPLKVKFDLLAAPLDFSMFAFPYIGVDNQSELVREDIENYYQKNNIQKDEIFKYLLSRKKYYKIVKADVESIHIAKQNPASFLIDNNSDTVWISDQSRWEVNIKPWIKTDLGDTRNIGRIIWREVPTRLIEKFTISTSLDGNTWTKVNNFSKKSIQNDKTLKIIDFDSISTRYVLINIDELAYGSPGPGLAELEIVENEFKNINLEHAFRISNSPFEYIENQEQLTDTYNYVSQNAKLKIKARTNRDDPNSNVVLEELPIVLDGQSHTYEFQLPQGGTDLKNISLETNFPSSLFINNVILENLSGSILRQQIEQKCQEFTEGKDYANPFICQ